MIVADTNVVSELMRDRPDAAVVEWSRRWSPGEVTITVVTVQEVERGLGRMPDGRRQRDLASRWRAIVSANADRLLVYDLDAARSAAGALVAREQAGLPMSLADAQIAGICLSRGTRLATRNAKDFAGVDGLELVDPWS